MMLLASFGTDNDLNGIMWHQHQRQHMMPVPVAIVSHDQKAMVQVGPA